MNFDEGLDNLAESFGARLKAFREEHGLSQSDVAERTGITREAINRYENGTVTPTLKYFAILVRFMDADAHWMLFGEANGAKGLVADRLMLKRFRAILALDVSSRHWFMDLVDAFLQNGKASRAQLAKLYEES